MGLLDLQDCELDDEMEAPAVEQRERRATIEEVNEDEQEEFTRAGPTTRRAAVRAAESGKLTALVLIAPAVRGR